jgi:peptidoglycan/LPS O-acetylase OafA/YrhL
MGVSLAERFDPRRNNLTLLRLVLAATVLVVHAQAISVGRQPGVFRADLGELAVDGFFVLSGFLVTGSALRLGSVRRFVWHRALRILPGFWICLAFTAFVAAPVISMLEGRGVGGVFAGPDSAPRFVLANAALLIRQFGVADLMADDPQGNVLNGSLWSLYYEGMCYAAVAVLMVVGVLLVRRVRSHGRHSVAGERPAVPRRALVAVLTLLVWATLLADRLGVVLPLPLGRRMFFTFLLGVLAAVYAGTLPMDGRLAAVCALLALSSCALMYEYRLVGGVPFAYALLWLAAAAPALPQPRHDLSYGVYMYHWPIFAALVQLGGGPVGLPVLLACGSLLTVGLAAASWFWVESPALAWKGVAWVQRPRTPGPQPPVPPPTSDAEEGQLREALGSRELAAAGVSRSR